jgi:hypothetical protein
MRLPESQIIAGLQNPSIFVRENVVEYLVGCNRAQPDVTRQIIAAIEQFGWGEVLQFPYRIASFDLDESSLPWLLAQIERRDADGPGENQRWHLAGMLAHAPIAFARPHLAGILALDVMHRDRTRFRRSRTNAELLELRNNLWDLSADECWRRLQTHCLEVADVEAFDEADIPLAIALVECIARDTQLAHDRALEILEQTAPNGDDQANPWLPGLMIYLAGRLRLESAAPLIYRQFARDWDWYNEEIMYALKRIGAPSVGALVSDNYLGSPEHVRIYSWGVLEAVHHDHSVDDVLRLLPHEDDDGFRGELGVALASHFDQRGVEPALEIFHENPEDPERFAIISRLYAHACLADLERPEREQWREWLESDWERFESGRVMLDRFAATLERTPDDWSDEGRFDDGEFADKASASLHASRDEYESYPRLQPIVRETARVGRNEHCPCGSGKKFKNCCLRNGP